jgi:hypothetical protein
VGVEEE